MSQPWHLYIMALLYILAGFNHFRNPKMYIRIVPSYFSNPNLINKLSGFAEIILGIGLLIPALTKMSAWGIILLLIAIFPANLNMYVNEKASFGLPKWFLLLRLPLQLAFIYWAYLYT
jgi:uncharacterized membrane protein